MRADNKNFSNGNIVMVRTNYKKKDSGRTGKISEDLGFCCRRWLFPQDYLDFKFQIWGLRVKYSVFSAGVEGGQKSRRALGSGDSSQTGPGKSWCFVTRKRPNQAKTD